ncbi:MAG: lysylphosphatidylglycerol synthase transmembrane domain-containing protein [Microbacterium sp.]
MKTPGWAVPSGLMRARPRVRAWARAAVGIGILVAIIVQVGAEPFVRGLAALTLEAVAVAFALGAAATVAAAARWRLISRRLGLSLGWGQAIAAYYRSQFLNTVLPGGVVGDVHRAVTHGRGTSRLAQASRAVAAERAVGQAVQLVLAAVVVVSLGLWDYAPGVGIVVLALAVGCVCVIIAARVSSRARAAIRREMAILRVAVGSSGTVVAVTAASVAVVACLVATFVVACVAVGVDAPLGRLIALGVIVILAGSIPLSIGGWGPREGVAAWAFALAGLGATTGIAVSTAYGVLAMIAVTPGAAVLAVSSLDRRRSVVGPVVVEFPP